MDHEPIFLTRLALLRQLKGLAQQLGLSDFMADAVAQIFLQTNPGPENWSRFLEANCANCQHSPKSCLFLNGEDQLLAGGGAQCAAQAAAALAVESGAVTRCPYLKIKA